jgi:hypothetical protein
MFTILTSLPSVRSESSCAFAPFQIECRHTKSVRSIAFAAKGKDYTILRERSELSAIRPELVSITSAVAVPRSAGIVVPMTTCVLLLVGYQALFDSHHNMF